MKLAEALMERADVQRRMEQLDDRLRASARTQEGEKPPEAPAALLAELDALAARHARECGRRNYPRSPGRNSPAPRSAVDLQISRG